MNASINIIHLMTGFPYSNRKVAKVSIAVENNFTPSSKTLNLTNEIYSARTSEALAIVAHECGHALQPNRFYNQLIITPWFVAAYMIFLMVLTDQVIHYGKLMALCLVMSRVFVLLSEFDASLRAYKFLKTRRNINLKIARRVLIKAFLTYLNIR